MTAAAGFISGLEAKVAEQLKAQRVGYLLGAGSSYLDDAGYPLGSDLWKRIKDRITDAQKRAEIQAKLDNGAAGIEHPLDLLDDGGAVDTPYRHLVTAAIADLFRITSPRLDRHIEFVHERVRRIMGGAPPPPLPYPPGDPTGVHGERGWAALDPAFAWDEERRLFGKLFDARHHGGKWFEKTFPLMDEFALEIDAFADCIMKRRDPEPDGIQGLRDVAVIEAIYRAARERRTVPVVMPE